MPMSSHSIPIRSSSPPTTNSKTTPLKSHSSTAQHNTHSPPSAPSVHVTVPDRPGRHEGKAKRILWHGNWHG
ncbi:hypothetical protein PSPO01_07583 [Paraphaeosphaeria sporulosa]